MKLHKFKKVILILMPVLLFLGTLLTTFFFSPISVSAESICEGPARYDFNIITNQIDSYGTAKAMPGETIKIELINNCDQHSGFFNIYVHPTSITPAYPNIEPYKKLSGVIVSPSETSKWDIPISGNEPGDYSVRVVEYLADNTGNIITTGGQETTSKSLRIATEGIVFPLEDNDSSVKQGETGNYKIKFYGHMGDKFSLYVDNVATPNIKAENISISSDPFIYSYSWDTSGTSIGNDHKIIVVLNNSHKVEFAVNVTDASTPGVNTGDGKTFSLSKLNSFNIKNLLQSCKSKTDLDQVLCVIETAIDWLLDIAAVIAIIMILYASIIYLTSYGEESKAELAKKTLIWSVIGVIIVGVAMGVLKIIENIFNR